MSASLVGSEMCIRDRQKTNTQTYRNTNGAQNTNLHQNPNGKQSTNTKLTRASGVGSLSLRTFPAPKSSGLVGDATLG
eukprot:14843143-Alexandrium_andersonii.AAC.1